MTRALALLAFFAAPASALTLPDTDLIYIEGVGFRGVEECTEYTTRVWADGHYHSVRMGWTCQDVPYGGGKAEKWTMDGTDSPHPMSTNITGSFPQDMASSAEPVRGIGGITTTASGTELPPNILTPPITSCCGTSYPTSPNPQPSPIPLPLPGALLLAALGAILKRRMM